MHRRLGSFANVSVSGTLTSGAMMAALSGGVLLPAYFEWAEQTRDAGQAAVDDVLYNLMPAPMRLVSAHAAATDGRLTSLMLILQPRSGEVVPLEHFRIEVVASNGPQSLDNGAARISALADADGSMARMVANGADLVRMIIGLDALEQGLAAGDAFEVWILHGDSKPLRLAVEVPAGESSDFFELSTSEILS